MSYLSEDYRGNPGSLLEESSLCGRLSISVVIHNKSSMFLVELLLSQLKLIITAVLAFCSKHIGS